MADLNYELSFKGAASPTLQAAFTNYAPDAGGGKTSLRCVRGELRSVIDLIQDLGLELLDVHLVADPAPDDRLGRT